MLYFEGFTCAKNAAAPETSEDQIVVVPNHIYAVIDGATDISGRRYDDRLGADATGGRLAARAVAEALHAIAGAPLPPLPEILTALTQSVAQVYIRLGIEAETVRSGDHRFRAAMAAAFIDGATARLVTIGDCAIRINGREILRHEFPADRVFAAARARAWHILADRGVAPDVARPAVRALIVSGLKAAPPDPLTPADADAIVAAVGTDAETRRILDGGLEAVRAAPEDFDALVVDGVSDVSNAALVRDLPLAEIETLEIFSDGYPALGDAPRVAAWEAALAHVDAVDPERVGAFASTKGRSGALFGDDRSILVLKSQPD